MSIVGTIFANPKSGDKEQVGLLTMADLPGNREKEGILVEIHIITVAGAHRLLVE